MEIHAPEKPVHSFKDFLVHISIVTIGILIALALEGLREHFHNQHLVRETRESFHVEMEENRDNAAHECKADVVARDQLKAVVDSLPASLAQHPQDVTRTLLAVRVPNYFLTATAWQAALSTGALAHMSTTEAGAYAGAAEGIRIYTEEQQIALPAQAAAADFFSAHPRLTPDQVADGTERLFRFYRAEQSLAYLCPNIGRNIDRALRASAP